MSDYRISFTNRMVRDRQRLIRRGKDMAKLESVLGLLAADAPLPTPLRDHALTGEWRGFRDCHIEPDWVLIYAKDRDRLVLVAVATGTHADLF